MLFLSFRYGPTMKMTNPPVVILSNWSVERVYHKAIEKDPTAVDSLLTRLLIVKVEENDPLDIDGFNEALARASAATTVIPTTLEVAQASAVTTSSKDKELDLNNSTTEATQELSPSFMESPICTPPWMIAQHPSTPPPAQEMDLNLPILGTPSVEHQINEEELIYAPELVPEKSDNAITYEKFISERRKKIREKQREEDSSFKRLERGKNNTILFTGYN